MIFAVSSLPGCTAAGGSYEQGQAATAPASILIQTPGLVVPELLVELVPVAVIPTARYRDPA